MTTETTTTETVVDDPFKDFIQAEYKDGVPTLAPAAEPTAEEKAAAEAAKVKKTEEEDDFADVVPVADDADDEAKRIDALAREKAKKMAQGRVGQLTAKTRKLERDLEAARKATPAPAATTVPVATDKAAVEALLTTDPNAPKAPDPAKFEFGNVDTGYIDAYHEYKDAVRDFKAIALQKLAEARATEAASAQEAGKLRDEIKTFREKHDAVPGFKEAMASADKDEFPVSEPLAHAVLESDVGPDVLIHLHQNPTLAKELSDLPAYAVGRRVAKLEAELAAAKAATAAAPAKTATAAPAPITSARGSSTPATSAEESEDFAAAEAKFNATLGRKTA